MRHMRKQRALRVRRRFQSIGLSYHNASATIPEILLGGHYCGEETFINPISISNSIQGNTLGNKTAYVTS